MISVAIVEDDPTIRSILTEFFNELTDYQLVISADSSEDFQQQWKKQHLDVVICDIGLPGKSGIENTWYIKKNDPRVHVVMFTVFEDRDRIFHAMCCGASGYLLKSTSLSKIKSSVEEILEGGAVMSPQIARQVFDFFISPPPAKAVYTEQLTSRETEIVSLIKQGLNNREIASRIFISVNSVKYHIKNIYLKLQINSRDELVRKFAVNF